MYVILVAMYGFLFFTACVMDSFAISTGQAVCDDDFANTSLSGDIQSKGLTLTCNLRSISDYRYYESNIICKHTFLSLDI